MTSYRLHRRTNRNCYDSSSRFDDNFMSMKEIALLGSALIVGLDNDESELLDLLHYIADIRSSIDTGVQVALRTAGLID